MTPPRFLFMQLYTSCNLRCPHCTFWQRPHTLKDKAGWQHRRHVVQRAAIVREFAALNPRGVVVTHGGEALLDFEDYLRFCGLCREHGLRVLTVTNGTQVWSSDRAERLVTGGPHEVSVSFDSTVPEEHDRFRGVPGAFDKAVRALRLLLAARSALGATTRIYAMLLVGRTTYRSLDSSYNFALNVLGVDKLKLNMVQPSFGLREGRDDFFADEHDVDPAELGKVLAAVDAKYDLAFDPAWVRQVVMYFRSLSTQPLVHMGWSADLKTEDHICDSYERNVWVDASSVMQLCCDSKWPGRSWDKPGDLRAFWEGADALRGQMASCNSLCGVSHSLRKTSSTLRAVVHGV